jgi:predicted metal-dependent phosphoesterase TrpH
VWFNSFIKEALRKHNLRVDLRVYPGEEISPPTQQELPSKLKSLMTSAIVKGLDVLGVVSKYGTAIGKQAQQIAKNNQLDIKVIAGQDYISSDGVKAVFYNLTQDISESLPIQEAIKKVKEQKGKVMLYDLSRSVAKSISSWQSTPYEPDLVEIYNAHSKAYKDLDIDYPRVISSAARSGSELENTPVYSELPRKRLEGFGLLDEAEGIEYTPGYLQEKQNA